MARERRSVPAGTRRRLVEEAGNKCANPGCVNFRTHLHHIDEWAVYESHDAQHMIAVCPTCHDAVHNGPLVIDDETVYRWKGVKRGGDASRRDHIYVEPGEASLLLLGSIAVTGEGGVTVFELSDTHRLAFRVADGDILLLNLDLRTLDGETVIRVVDGHVVGQITQPVQYGRVPGHIRVTAPPAPELIPPRALDLMRQREPDFGRDGVVPLLDLEVLEPGLVRVQGIWARPSQVVVITPQALTFLWPSLQRSLPIVGAGRSSLIHYVGPITSALFGLADEELPDD